MFFLSFRITVIFEISSDNMIDVSCDRPLGVSSPVSSSFFLTGLPLCGYFNILDYSAFYTIIEVVALVWSSRKINVGYG